MAASFQSAAEAQRLLGRLGVRAVDGDLVSRSPIDGQEIGRVAPATKAEITPTTPSGCQVSIIRWPGRSVAMVRP